jgi:hypothetical protein
VGAARAAGADRAARARTALAESRRLAGASDELDSRLDCERSERTRLEHVLRAQDDPIYLERERRLLRSENGPLPVK